MKRVVLFLFVGGLPLVAAENSIQLDPARTTVSFTLGDVLHTVHGTFRLKRGAVKFDSATGSASGEIVVDVASGNSGNGGRDCRLAHATFAHAHHQARSALLDLIDQVH